MAESQRNVHEWNTRLSDFSDTAQLLLQLDLVITVDTAVAHLAGALNKPAHGYYCLRMRTFVGCASGQIRLGIPLCGYFGSRAMATGNRLSISLTKLRFNVLAQHQSTCFSEDVLMTNPSPLQLTESEIAGLVRRMDLLASIGPSAAGGIDCRSGAPSPSVA